MTEESPIITGLKPLHGWQQRVVMEMQKIIELAMSANVVPSGALLQMEMLASDIQQSSLRIAFVGEFSRGKSELINALLCTEEPQTDAIPQEYRRLLPSSAGQTTMCPVEIQGMHQDGPQGRNSLRLLPIATRSMDVSMEKLKTAKSAWQHFSWTREDWKERKEAMVRMTETVCVNLEDARKLGLCPPMNRTPKGLERTVCPSCGLGKVLIPRWRYGVVQMDHPLLNAGLTVLDTPGLNALGAEPELTRQMLSDAHAVLFVLGIDTGLKQSDLSLWDQFMANGRQQQLILLNKIDALWDALQNESDIQEEIAQQVHKTAQQLNIDPFQIVPLSGQKALIARIRGDRRLLERSGLPALEQAMTEILVPWQYAHIRERAEAGVGEVIADQSVRLQEKRRKMEAQQQILVRQRDQTREKVPPLIAKHRAVLKRFQDDKARFEAQNEQFRQAVEKHLLTPLSPRDFEVIIENAKKEMLSSWTTKGIVDRFRKFFDEAIAHFDRALAGAQKVSELFVREYESLRTNYDLPNMQMVPYAIMPRRSELLEMAANYERFGKTMEMAASTKNTIVRSMFLDVATRTRDFVVETHRDAVAWVDKIIEALNQQLDDFEAHKQHELEALEQLDKTMEQMEVRVQQVQKILSDLQADETRAQEAVSAWEKVLTET